MGGNRITKSNAPLGECRDRHQMVWLGNDGNTKQALQTEPFWLAVLVEFLLCLQKQTWNSLFVGFN